MDYVEAVFLRELFPCGCRAVASSGRRLRRRAGWVPELDELLGFRCRALDRRTFEIPASSTAAGALSGFTLGEAPLPQRLRHP
jgi:hypothetical protein